MPIWHDQDAMQEVRRQRMSTQAELLALQGEPKMNDNVHMSSNSSSCSSSSSSSSRSLFIDSLIYSFINSFNYLFIHSSIYSQWAMQV